MVKDKCSSNDYLKTERSQICELILPTTEELSSIYSSNESLMVLVEIEYQARIQKEFMSVTQRIEHFCKNILSENCLSIFVAAELMDSQLQSLATKQNDTIWKTFFLSARNFLMTLLVESVTKNQDLALIITEIYNILKKAKFPWENKRFSSVQHFFGGLALFTVLVLIKSVIGNYFPQNPDCS